jgi:hypothetical protein
LVARFRAQISADASRRSLSAREPQATQGGFAAISRDDIVAALPSGSHLGAGAGIHGCGLAIGK